MCAYTHRFGWFSLSPYEAPLARRAEDFEAENDSNSQDHDAQEVGKARQNQALFSANPLDAG